MSGPKIVDIRLVQAMQERQRRLARKRFEQLQQQWKAQRQRIRAALGTVSLMADADEINGIELSITATEAGWSWTWPTLDIATFGIS